MFHGGAQLPQYNIGSTSGGDGASQTADGDSNSNLLVKAANMQALSMFPGHSHSPRPYPTTPHSPAAASAAAAATAAAAAAQAPYFAGYGYHHHQQQFPGIGGLSPYYHLNSDLNSNLNYAAAGFPGSAFNDPGSASTAAAAATGGSHSPTTWHGPQWHNNPFGASCRSSAYGSASGLDNWPPPDDLQQQQPGDAAGPAASNSDHSPGDHHQQQQQQNESGNSGSSSGPASSVPPPANSASPTPFPAAVSAARASPGDGGNPQQQQQQPFSNNNGGDLFPKGFLPGSPPYGKGDSQLASSTPPPPPPGSGHFGLPSCITVTPQQNLPPLTTTDGHALSPSSLSPGGNAFTPPSILTGGGGGGGLSGGRPQPARSPFEWMKKPSYQSQPEKNGQSAEESTSSPWQQTDHLEGGEESEDGGRTRTKDKYRVVYSDHQRLELEKEFHYSRYITIRRKAELASNVGLSERQVKIWFQNRRAKERRALKKQEDIITKDKLEQAAANAVAMSAFESLSHAHIMGAAPPPPPGAAFAPPPPVSSSPSAAAAIAASAASQLPPPPPHSHLNLQPPPSFPMKFE